MKTRFFPRREMIFTRHQDFDNVKIAMFLTGEDAEKACVCLIEIAPGSETQLHRHEETADSIFVVGGYGRNICQWRVAGHRSRRLSVYPGRWRTRHP